MDGRIHSTGHKIWKGEDSPIKNNNTNLHQIQKRIGNTNYIFSVRFSDTSKETLEYKIFRLMEREVKSLLLHVSKPNVPPIAVTAGMKKII